MNGKVWSSLKWTGSSFQLPQNRLLGAHQILHSLSGELADWVGGHQAPENSGRALRSGSGVITGKNGAKVAAFERKSYLCTASHLAFSSLKGYYS